MYTYEPIHQDARVIRLLRPRLSFDNEDEAGNLELELRVVSLDPTPEYCALSYVWGDESRSVKVALGGARVSIRRNLYEALVQLLQNGLEHDIWVDALCIDQANLEEKSWHVNQMGHIFSEAIMVYSWLGPAADDSELAMQQLQLVGEQALTAGIGSLVVKGWPDKDRISKFLESVRPEGSTSEDTACDFAVKLLQRQELHDPRTVHSISSILDRDYWHRIWIVQEFALAKHGLVVCGEQRLSIDAFDAALSAIFVSLHPSVLQNMPSASSYLPSFNATYFETRAITARRERRGSRPINLLDLLETFTGTPGRPLYSASDPRDVVFGLLAICDDVNSLGLHADYRKSVAEVYTEASYAFLTHSPNYELSYCTFPKDLTGLPSWVPDWGRKGKLGIEIYPIAYGTRFNASSNRKSLPILDSSLDPTVLRHLGCRVGTVVAVLSLPKRRLFRHGHLLLEHKNEWLESIANFGQVGSISNTDEDILWRTLVLNHFPQCVEVTTGWVELARVIFRRERLVPESLTEIQLDDICCNHLETPKDSQQTAHQLVENFTNSCLEWTGVTLRHRTLFRMASGRVCVGPESTQEGDIVSILFGNQAPIILRPLGTGQYSYVGDAYVHDVMYGQFMETKPTEEIFNLV